MLRGRQERGRQGKEEEGWGKEEKEEEEEATLFLGGGMICTSSKNIDKGGIETYDILVILATFNHLNGSNG